MLSSFSRRSFRQCHRCLSLYPFSLVKRTALEHYCRWTALSPTLVPAGRLSVRHTATHTSTLYIPWPEPLVRQCAFECGALLTSILNQRGYFKEHYQVNTRSPHSASFLSLSWAPQLATLRLFPLYNIEKECERPSVIASTTFFSTLTSHFPLHLTPHCILHFPVLHLCRRRRRERTFLPSSISAFFFQPGCVQGATT